MDLYGFFYSSKFAFQALQLQYYSFEKQKKHRFQLQCLDVLVQIKRLQFMNGDACNDDQYKTTLVGCPIFMVIC